MTRVIAGSAKGRHLVTPEGMNTRPTTDRLKEALFGMIQFDLAGSSFLDLFAGSGQMGIEALSRGASSLVLVEQDPRALSCIRRNLQLTGFAKQSRLISASVERAIPMLQKEGLKFDLIFMDPPYDHGFEKKIGELIAEHDLLSEDGMLIIESSSGTEVELSGLSRIREKTYKTTRFTFFERLENQ